MGRLFSKAGLAVILGVTMGVAGLLLALHATVFAPPDPEPDYRWNDFSPGDLAPSAEQVQAHLSEAAPADRDKATYYIRTVLKPRFIPPEIRDKLLALKDWGGDNVFLVRGQWEGYVIQLAERASELNVTAVAPGREPAQDVSERRAFANQVASEMLNDALLPSAALENEIHESVTAEGLARAAWALKHPIEDEFGVEIAYVHYYTDGKSVRFRFSKMTPHFASAFPPRYVFPPPEPAAPVQPREDR